MIDSSIMNLMMELATFSFIVPLVLIIVWKLRTRKSLIPVFIGAGIFLCLPMYSRQYHIPFSCESIVRYRRSSQEIHGRMLYMAVLWRPFLKKRDDTLLSEYFLKIMLNVRRQYPMAWDTVALNALSC